MSGIGMMRHRIVLQERISAPDGAGGFAGGWRDLESAPEVFAAVTVLSAPERLRFRQLQPGATHRILIRRRDDVVPGMRLLKDGHAYGILSVADRDGRGVILELLASVSPG